MNTRKALVLTFTKTLWGETRGTGVRVLAIAPGATDTPFVEVAGDAAAAGAKRSPEALVSNAPSQTARQAMSTDSGTRSWHG
ncbi:hypothetical protein [Microbacterium sp.]|uniref:hypothetical protein n=1 Tax=Microbacterium sp. TaxID=51671 RepID=UPI003C7338E5